MRVVRSVDVFFASLRDDNTDATGRCAEISHIGNLFYREFQIDLCLKQNLSPLFGDEESLQLSK